jgi:hypothetical protein
MPHTQKEGVGEDFLLLMAGRIHYVGVSGVVETDGEKERGPWMD